MAVAGDLLYAVLLVPGMDGCFVLVGDEGCTTNFYRNLCLTFFFIL